ncbi:MAG: PRC-barrel domain-containing protein [Acidimicrobiales bacterium]
MDDGQPISYEAITVGTPVVSSTGSEFGTVHHVLQVPELDLFDGLSVKTRHGLRFVDRDQIDEITTTAVRCALSDDQAAALPAPSGPPVEEVDLAAMEGPSLSARLNRLFGRPHWREIDK